MAPSKVDPKSEPSLARLELWFACPNCGAPASADEESSTVACGHCQSHLFVARPDAPIVGMAECVLRSDDDLRRVYIERRLAERRADLCAPSGSHGVDTQLASAAGRALGLAMGGPVGGALAGVVMNNFLGGGAGSSGGTSQAPLFLEQLLDAERRRLETNVKLGEHRLLHVPYWQVRALILQGIFGRARGGAKVMSVRARRAEQSTPAYDASRWNMRDAGLRLGTARMKLVTPRDTASGAIFLRVAPETKPERDDLERWARLPPQDMDRLHARNELAATREFIVYRPIWLAQMLEGSDETWLLIEAGTGIVGGLVTDATELTSFLAERGVDPFTSLAPTRVMLAASRCVECGRDIDHESGPWMRACPYCRTGLALTGEGIVRAPYDHAVSPETAPAQDTTWLPCWSFRFALRSSSGEMIVTLEELAVALGVPPALRTVSGDRLHVPATRMLGLPKGVKAFDDLCEWLHRARLQGVAGPIPTTATGAALGCELRESEARELARCTLFALLDAPMIARLTAATVRERLDQIFADHRGMARGAATC